MSTEIALMDGESFTQEELQVFENQYLAKFKNLAEVTKQKKALEEQEKKTKAELEKLMDEYGIKSLDNQYIKIIRVAGSSTTSIDLKKLEEKEPDLYEELLEDYPKTTTRKATVRFDVK
jgi:ABC-type lipopolysaccharide export system ATPase subunit